MFDVERIKKIKLELDKSKEIMSTEVNKINDLYNELSDFLYIVNPAVESLEYACDHLNDVIYELGAI